MLPLIMSLLAIFIIAFITSLFCHLFIKKRWPANIASVTYAALTFHGLSYIEMGSVDPNWLITSLIIAMVTLPVAIFTGRVVDRWRSRKNAAAPKSIE